MRILNKIIKKFIVGVILITLFVVSIITVLQVSEKNYKIIKDPDELMAVAEADNLKDIIIDLREQADYELSHIGSSINIPYTDGKELDEYLMTKNSKNKYIYLLCYSGTRSAKTFNYLSELGYKNLFYVTFGYDEFVDTIGEAFIPDSGPCGCLN